MFDQRFSEGRDRVGPIQKNFFSSSLIDNLKNTLSKTNGLGDTKLTEILIDCNKEYCDLFYAIDNLERAYKALIIKSKSFGKRDVQLSSLLIHKELITNVFNEVNRINFELRQSKFFNQFFNREVWANKIRNQLEKPFYNKERFNKKRTDKYGKQINEMTLETEKKKIRRLPSIESPIYSEDESSDSYTEEDSQQYIGYSNNNSFIEYGSNDNKCLSEVSYEEEYQEEIEREEEESQYLNVNNQHTIPEVRRSINRVN